jgi:nucleotide-binding universal stress UspA family protein
MPPHVLVAYDDSAQAEAALAFALDAFPDANVTLLTVIDPVDTGSRRRIALPPFGDQWLERAREDARDALEDAADRVADAGLEVDTTIEVGRPANTIVEYAEAHDVDHVVTGSHGRSGVTRILLGSVAETVIRRSPVPVTVARVDESGVDSPSADSTAADSTSAESTTADSTNVEDAPESESANGTPEDAASEVSGEGSA